MEITQEQYENLPNSKKTYIKNNKQCRNCEKDRLILITDKKRLKIICPDCQNRLYARYFNLPYEEENKEKKPRKPRKKPTRIKYKLDYKGNTYYCKTQQEIADITEKSPHCIYRIICNVNRYKRKNSQHLREIKITRIDKNGADRPVIPIDFTTQLEIMEEH